MEHMVPVSEYKLLTMKNILEFNISGEIMEHMVPVSVYKLLAMKSILYLTFQGR
jgi:hypothetical protein